MVGQSVQVGFIHCEPLQEGGEFPPGPLDYWNPRTDRLINCVARQRPDWLWVQLSGYGYSRWGAPYRLGRSLAAIRAKLPDVRLAICVHETHCQPGQLGIKGPLLSAWQRRTVARIVRLGDIVFPSILPYMVQVIRDYEVCPSRVVRLPIGSNVPTVALTNGDRANTRRSLGWGEDETVAVTFGTFSTQLRALQGFETLLRDGLEQGKLDRVVFIGGEQPQVPAEFSRRIMQMQRPGAFQILGPQPARRIGEILACADFAFVRTPRHMLEKSGAFIAFAMSGLAVLTKCRESSDELCKEGLPVLSAETWDWREAQSQRIIEVRHSLRQHAHANYSWGAIARRALAAMQTCQKA
jgi:hypothetical protein